MQQKDVAVRPINCVFWGLMVLLLQTGLGTPMAQALLGGDVEFEDVECGKPIELHTFIGEDLGYGFKDTDGNVVLEPNYSIAWSFNSSGYGYADGAYINAKGERVFTIFMVDNGPDYIFEGMHRFRRDDKVGYLTESMDVAIEPKFDYAGFFHRGLAVACEGCKEVPRFDDGDWEHTKWAGGSWGVIDKAGVYVVPPTLTKDDIGPLITDLRNMRKNDKAQD